MIGKDPTDRRTEIMAVKPKKKPITKKKFRVLIEPVGKSTLGRASIRKAARDVVAARKKLVSP
jgi:hypothetical protein